jgi:hypothetical protein
MFLTSSTPMPVRVVTGKFSCWKNRPGPGSFVKRSVYLSLVCLIGVSLFSVIVTYLLAQGGDCLTAHDGTGFQSNCASPSWSTAIRTTVFLIFSNPVQTISGLFVSSGVIYQYLSTDLGKKWEFCAKLYNDLYLRHYYSTPIPSDPKVLKFLETGLALDLLLTDLWGHWSFVKFFERVIDDAIKSTKQKKPRTEKNARNLLERYHSDIKAEFNFQAVISDSRTKAGGPKTQKKAKTA